MQWERDLEAHFKLTQKIRTAFVIAGVLIAVVGTIWILFNFENECLETFGLFPSEIGLLSLLYLTLPYLFWGLAFVLTGFALERLLNFQNAKVFVLSLMLLPPTYGVFRFILTLFLNLGSYLAYSDLIQYLSITGVLIGVYFLAGYIVRRWIILNE